MKKALFLGRALTLAVIVAAIASKAALAAPAPAPVDTSWCTAPLLSQPFLGHGDKNDYMLVPGQAPANFDGAGWTLTGGAQIVSTTLADGTTGSVLDLPSGAEAVSPTICVQSNYPNARAMVRDVTGDHGISFGVSYQGRPTWDDPKYTGHIHGKKTDWTLSSPVNVHPYGDPGWQPVRFILAPAGKGTETQVYSFYVDPRMRW